MQMKLDQVSRSVGDLVALHRESGNRDMTSSTGSSSLHKEMTDAIHSSFSKVHNLAENIADASARRMTDLVTREIESHADFVRREVGSQVSKVASDMTEVILKACVEDPRVRQVQRLQDQAVAALAEAAEARLELERHKVDASNWRGVADRARADLERLQTENLSWFSNFREEEKCAVSVAQDCLQCESSLELGAVRKEMMAELTEKASSEMAQLKGKLIFAERCCDIQNTEIVAMQQNMDKGLAAHTLDSLGTPDILAEIVAEASTKKISEFLTTEMGSHADFLRRQLGESSLQLQAATGSLRTESEKVCREMALIKESRNARQHELTEGHAAMSSFMEIQSQHAVLQVQSEMADLRKLHDKERSLLEMESKSAKADIADLRKAHNQERSLLEMQSKNAIREVEAEMADLRKSHDDELSSMRAAAENALQRSSCRYSELEASLAESHKENEAWKKQQLQELKANHERSPEMDDMLRSAQQDARAFKSEVTSLRAEADKSRIELSEAQNELQAASKNASNARREALNARSEADKTQMDMEKLRASLNEATTQAHPKHGVEKLQTELGTAQQELKDAKAKLVECEQKAASEEQAASNTSKTLVKQLGDAHEQLKETMTKLKHVEATTTSPRPSKDRLSPRPSKDENLADQLKVANEQLAETRVKLKQAEAAQQHLARMTPPGKDGTTDVSQDLEKVRESLKEAKADARRLRRDNLQLKEEMEKTAAGDVAAGQNYMKNEIERLREENYKAQLKSQASQEESARVLKEVVELQQQLRESRLETRRAQEQAGIVKDKDKDRERDRDREKDRDKDKKNFAPSRSTPRGHVAKTATT